VPQIDLDVDRVKAKSLGVSLSSLYETLQVYLGSLYVNDFNQFGRTYQVVAQADSKFRDGADDIRRLKVRNERGQMVPMGTLVTVREAFGPDRVMRYNGYPAFRISGDARPGHTTGEAMAELKLTQSCIVTRNEEDRIGLGSGVIEVVPAWRFLLNLPEGSG
jgi:multidrug efflux pump